MTMNTSSKHLDLTKISKGFVFLSSFAAALLVFYIASWNNVWPFLPSVGFSNSSGLNGSIIREKPPVINLEIYELRKALKAAATKGNTVILTTLNEAWAAPNSIFDLFLESFRIGNNTAWLLKHLLVIAVDDNAYERCKVSVSHCYQLKINQSRALVGQAAEFMSPHYLDIVWQRLAFLKTVLDLGYNFINTDTDVMWFRDPFPQFYPDSDFQTSCDVFNGKEFDLNNFLNIGFMFVRSNNRTIPFFEFWIQSRYICPKLQEDGIFLKTQDVFNMIKNGRFMKDVGLRMRFLDTQLFGGFCSPTNNIDKAYTMHANCCVGLPNKIADLNTTLEDWKNYLTNKPSEPLYWRVPNKCIWQL